LAESSAPLIFVNHSENIWRARRLASKMVEVVRHMKRLIFVAIVASQLVDGFYDKNVWRILPRSTVIQS
jgi:hypothetical protein